MNTEKQCKSSGRFLFASECFSDKAIDIWQSECIKRCRDKVKGRAYDRYINWTRQKNEIAVFTLYAYADFSIPKKFDIIFHLDDPSEFLRIDFELTQCIHEAWFPLDRVDAGHKHLCIFSFHASLPDILNTLHTIKKQFSESTKGQKSLGFCNSEDFDAIRRDIEKKL
jgi:hypothetical protein